MAQYSPVQVSIAPDLGTQLSIQNERFEYAARATTDVIRDWDLNTGQVYWGESFETRYGYNRLPPSDHIDFWYGHIHPLDAERVRQETGMAINNGVCNQFEIQYRFKKSNGEYIYIIDRAFIIRNSEGKALRVVGALHDNTEVKAYEDMLQELNGQLEKRAGELARSNAELERFAYVASHDLQEPLRMVSSFLELLKKKYDGQLDATAHQYINFAVDGAVRMKTLIHDLLAYSRIGKNGFSLQMAHTGDIIQQIEQLYAADIHAYKVNIIKKKLPSLVANRQQMAQLFQNLIGNAIKYRKGHNLTIEINAELKNDKYVFSIADNGIGIEMKFANKIFIIFQRLHQKEEYPGTGIGLAICRKIIHMHRGEIWVNAEKGKGSTFYFTIPNNLKITDNEGN